MKQLLHQHFPGETKTKRKSIEKLCFLQHNKQTKIKENTKKRFTTKISFIIISFYSKCIYFFLRF